MSKLMCQNDVKASLKAVAQYLFLEADHFIQACRIVWDENSAALPKD